MQPSVPEPVFLNVEYLFFLILRAVGGFFAYIFSVEFIRDFKIVATVLVILLIAYVLYLLVRLYELQEEEKKKAVSPVAASTAPAAGIAAAPAAVGGTSSPARNETWEAIRAKLLSDNQSDWRLAIIEADIYMDKLLDDKGYHGDTTSDKLKQVSPGDLGSIQIAWEAHKVRNRIAHDGAAFTLTQPEARRVLSYFEIVFRDLEAIE